MYGRAEYLYYMRELGDLNAALDSTRQTLADRVIELGQDLAGRARAENRIQSTDERMAIATVSAARVMVSEAMEAIDRAIALLPVPVAPVRS
jgi:hypothetical protein